jgi:hypothetical protein
MSARSDDIIEGLNPADYFTLAMDQEIRNDGLAGSYGCFALTLSQKPDIEELTRRIRAFFQQFPVANARLKQKGRRFYWCKPQQPPVFLQQHRQTEESLSEDDFHHQVLQRLVNERKSRELLQPIEFHLISGTRQHTFFCRWIHPFCDARGADLILQYLCCEDEKQRQQFGQPKTAPLVNQQLKRFSWWQKLGLLLKGKRYIDRLDSLKSIQAFGLEKPAQQLDFAIYRLSEEQTQTIQKNARQYCGLTGASLYYIGCLMRALDKLNPDSDGEAYCSPYAFNLRKQRALTPVTGNHVCALFAQAPRPLVKNRQALFDHLKQQNQQVIRQQLDYAFLPLMWAGSWLSLEEYGKTLRLSYGCQQERSSFWFSDIGTINLANAHFPGADIYAIYHICQVTSPPSLAFLTGIYQGQLSLSYNFVEPSVSRDDIDKLHALVLAELLDQ